MTRIEDPQGLLRVYGRTDLSARTDGDSIVVKTGDRTRRLSRTNAVELFPEPERPAKPESTGLPLLLRVWLTDRI